MELLYIDNMYKITQTTTKIINWKSLIRYVNLQNFPKNILVKSGDLKLEGVSLFYTHAREQYWYRNIT